MPVRRHDNSPPYEVMNLKRSSGKDAELQQEDSPQAASWRERAHQPLLLRVPRGYLALCSVAVLGMLILAYQVGYSRGQSAASQRYQAHMEAERQMRILAAAQSVAVDPAADPRQPGKWYFVLARYPLEEARRLAAVLGEYEVEAAVIRGNNNLFRVVDLQGFDESEIRSPAYQQREHLLRQIGRIWRQQHRGPCDLSDLHPQQYQG